MLESIFTLNPAAPFSSAGAVVFNLLLSFVLVLIVSWVYKKTHKGLSYSQSFVMTLILAGVIISAVMMIIGNNIARAFGAFGAFSIIRFRTAIKDAKDIAYLFLVLAIGMAVGTRNYLIAVATTVVSLLIIWILTKTNYGSIRKFDYILTFGFDAQKNQENVYKTVFDKYLKTSQVLNIKAVEGGHILQLSFSIKFINENEIQQFISALEKLGSLTDINLITAKNDVEY
jgi:uncharacterized membrane protein YhiD involved in acid resistance